MFKDLKPYPEYKNSENQFLGEVPSSWSIRSLGSLLTPKAERQRPDLPLLSVVREKGVIVRSLTDDDNHNVIPDDLSNYKVVRPGNLVINKMKAWQGSLGVSAHEGIVSPAYFVYNFSLKNLRFAHLLLRSRPYVSCFARVSEGVRIGQWDLSIDGMKRIPVLIPSEKEQEAIVHFVDYADRCIRQYVQTKQKLSKLLEEQKKKIIYTAVTCGLDEGSRTVFLGSIPEHKIKLGWKISRLWEISKLRSEKGRTDLDLLSVFLGRGVIRYGEGGGQVHKPSLDLSKYQVVQPGDLVLNNQQAWRGSVGVSEFEGIISPAYVVLDLDLSLQPRFADYLFKSRVIVSQFVTASKGVGDIQRDIHMPWLKNVKIPIPPLEEQERIVTYLDQELAEIEYQLRLIEKEIQLLGEFRIKIMADVVTGKFDVRVAVEKLPKSVLVGTKIDETEDLSYGIDDEEPSEEAPEEAEELTT